MELMEQYREDRHKLLMFLLSGKSIQTMPGGISSLDDLDTDQIDVDYILDSANKGVPIDLSMAIKSYYQENNFENERGKDENCEIKYVARRKLKSSRFSNISKKPLQSDVIHKKSSYGHRNDVRSRGLQYEDLRNRDLTTLYKKKFVIPKNEDFEWNNEIRNKFGSNKVSWDDLRTVCKARGLHANGTTTELTLTLLQSYQQEDEGNFIAPVKVKKSRRLHYRDLPREDLIILCQNPDPTLGKEKISEKDLEKMSEKEMVEYLGGSGEFVTWNDLRKLCRSHHLKANVKIDGLTRELVRFYDEVAAQMALGM